MSIQWFILKHPHESRSLELNPGLQEGVRPKYLSHELLPPRVCTGRKLESGAEAGNQIELLD